MTSRFTCGLALTTAALVGLLGTLGASALGCSSDEPAEVAPEPVVPEIPPAPPDTPPVPQPDAAPPKVVPKPTFPEVQSRGGPVIKDPRVVPIVFAGDPLSAQITEFTAKISASSYWKTVGLEYGVGPMTALSTITVAEAAPTTISAAQIETWLAQKLSGASPAFGAPDAGTLYAIYFPQSTTITMDGAGALGQSCEGYGGYHFEIAVAGVRIGYAVLPRCAGIDDLTVAASHEYFEWATDPFPSTKPAFSKVDDAHWAWQATMIGEVSDLCTFLDRDNLRPPEIGFEVQRHWSNVASLAGKYPCAPAKSAPYLQAIATAEDDAIVASYGTFSKPITTKAIRVPPGGSRTVDVLVYSDQPPPAELVPLRAMSYEELWGAAATKSGFAFTVEPTYGKVGETVAVTISAPKNPAYELMVMLAYTGPQSAHYWPILVVNDDGADAAAGKPAVTPQTMPKKPTRERIPFTRLGIRRPGPQSPQSPARP